MEEDCLWQNLTDPLLLDIFIHLNARSLLNVAQTCKNWYRLAHYDRLWMFLLFRHISKEVELPSHSVTWQEEYKRLVHHTPTELVQTCAAHSDEIYHVAFSASGQYFSTTGREGKVCLWRFCNPTKLIKSAAFVDTGYTRYSEFNQSETMLLVGGLKGSFMHEGYICIASVPGLKLLYAVRGEYNNFRGTWLNDRTFLNAGHYFDDRTYFKLDAHKVPPESKTKSDVSDMFDRCHALGKQVLKIFPCNPRNDFISVVDPKRWKNFDVKTERGEESGDTSTDLYVSHEMHEKTSSENVANTNDKDDDSEDSEPSPQQHKRHKDGGLRNTRFDDSSDSDDSDDDIIHGDIILERFDGWKSVFSLDSDNLGKIVMLSHTSRYSTREACLAFYYISSEPTDHVSQPFKTLDMKAGMLGLRVSEDHRYLVYNRRLLIENDPGFFGGHYHRNIQAVVYDMYAEKHQAMVYEGSMASSVDRISYIFPDACDLYVASGSESNIAHLWDRHYGVQLAQIIHDTADPTPTHSGVNAVIFHPHDPEILLTVADDCQVKIWMSKHRKSIIQTESHTELGDYDSREDEQGLKVSRDMSDSNDEQILETHNCCFCSRVKKRR